MISKRFNSGTTNDMPTKGVYVGLLYFNTDIGKYIVYNGTTWITLDGNPFNALKSGTTAERPVNVRAGFYFFDTTLNKPVWKKADTGTEWVDATGVVV